jgi:hypothetical protein
MGPVRHRLKTIKKRLLKQLQADRQRRLLRPRRAAVHSRCSALTFFASRETGSGPSRPWIVHRSIIWAILVSRPSGTRYSITLIRCVVTLSQVLDYLPMDRHESIRVVMSVSANTSASLLIRRGSTISMHDISLRIRRSLFRKIPCSAAPGDVRRRGRSAAHLRLFAAVQSPDLVRRRVFLSYKPVGL